MSSWKIAAAQYAPLNASPAEHVAHHLEYIELAARQQCELLVFPSLSLLGCDERNKSLPAPPDEALFTAAHSCGRYPPYDYHCGYAC
ncbi:carbon-nitrogen family hydrolase [Salmonella enterica subsp. enterica serovar Heidelberg str. 77-1831]|nr:carbon-nitrogen family hydrolase [Salmonella enterica subsp. enterica serovar Heidelberg str. 77-1831]